MLLLVIIGSFLRAFDSYQNQDLGGLDDLGRTQSINQSKCMLFWGPAQSATKLIAGD